MFYNIVVNFDNYYSLNWFKQNECIKYGNNVILNFNVINLNKEYERIKKLEISKITEIMYADVVVPYYFF